MLDKITNLREKFMEEISNVKSLEDLNNIRVNYLSKKGYVVELLNYMKDLSLEEKKTIGMEVNNLKQYVDLEINRKKELLEEEKINEKIQNEAIDITLDEVKIPMGAPHLLEKFIEEVEEAFIAMGYDVVEGPELEKDLYNFELLNLPKGHPARDAQDTFYTKDDTLLLRSQTSPVQIREMLANTNKEPIRIICPGKTYRRDDDDATHSHQFTQIEGLLIDTNISLADLKGTFDYIAKKIYGKNIKTRFRPSYYPFTEPSVEMDIMCFNCGGKGCSICKNTGWITIGGAGMVHYNVLKNCGYDSDIYSGFAFGFGAERLAMLKYNINDVRAFYNNDLRNVKNNIRGDE